MQKLSIEFDERTQARHEMGETKYGPGTWMKIDSVEMAIEELLDMANYLRFSYIKLRMIQEVMETDKSTAKPLPGNEMLGKDAFISGRDGVK